MDRELYYGEVDLATNSATMRVYGEIGFDVDANTFASELRYIVGMGITNIAIRINSGGGSVVDAFTMFSELTTCTANITTYNDGIAASAAGWLFMAGKSAIMRDYSLLMMHNPLSPDNSPKGMEVLALMRNSIITILSARSGNDPKVVAKMMDAETWLSADDAVAKGFATGIEKTELLGVLVLQPEQQTVNAMYAICNSAINKKELDMTDNVENTETVEATNEVENTVEAVAEITNEVEATEETTEETVEAAEEITNEVEETVDVVAEEKIEVVNKIEVINAYNRIAELEKELKQLKDAEAKRVADEKQKAGSELVSNAVAAGKIKSSASAEWVKMAVENYAFTKSALDAIVINKAGVNIMNDLKTTEKPAMKLRELEKADPAKVTDIYKNNPELYNQMYYDQYGVYPNRK